MSNKERKAEASFHCTQTNIFLHGEKFQTVRDGIFDTSKVSSVFTGNI